MDFNLKFTTDLKQGNIGERIIAKKLKENGYNILEFGNTMDWDIKIEKDGFIKTIEVKTDRWEYFHNMTTNNMFLETKCNGKPSGIIGTKADYFIYFYPEHELAYLIRTDEIIKLANYGSRKAYVADKNKVIGYTINRFQYQDQFKIINIKRDSIWDSIKREDN
jgi:hypothetical protein